MSTVLLYRSVNKFLEEGGTVAPMFRARQWKQDSSRSSNVFSIKLVWRGLWQVLLVSSTLCAGWALVNSGAASSQPGNSKAKLSMYVFSGWQLNL